MNGNASLQSLPEEVLHYLCNFLKGTDVLSLSATCLYLKSVLNYNSVWHKYSRGGAVSLALQGVTSLVKPDLFSPDHAVLGDLEHPCEQKLHFTRQIRLFNNYCSGKFVRISVPFEFFLSDFETTHLLFSSRQITYKDQYLFSLGYGDDCIYPEEVKVYNIERAPYLQAKFKIIDHLTESQGDPYGVVVWVKVVENKLVVRQDNWFDVYEIRLPDLEFSFLHSIDVKVSPFVDSLFFVRDLIIVENYPTPSSMFLNVWNISSGTRLDDINPKIKGSDLKVCNSSGNKQDILLSVEVSVGVGPFITPHLFVYSLKTFQYTDFYAVLPFKLVPTNSSNYYGLISIHYVVLIHDNKQKWTADVFVYDSKSSELLVQKTLEMMNKIDSCIVNEQLALRKNSTVEVLNLSNLETVWEIKLEASTDNLGNYVWSTHCFDMLSLNHLILVQTPESVEVWNFENRKKCFVLPKSVSFITMSDSFSKLILLKSGVLETMTFW